jgi:hypothetical protein
MRKKKATALATTEILWVLQADRKKIVKCVLVLIEIYAAFLWIKFN